MSHPVGLDNRGHEVTRYLPAIITPDGLATPLDPERKGSARLFKKGFSESDPRALRENTEGRSGEIPEDETEFFIYP